MSKKNTDNKWTENWGFREESMIRREKDMGCPYNLE